MIEETIHIHDKYQFEIKLGYQLEKKKRATIYDIETYLFFPNSLGINRYSYSKTDFYNDIQAYIRLKTPTVLLQDIVSGTESPLSVLQASIERLLANITKITIARYEYQIKMFCCIFKSAIRDHVAFMLTKETPGDIEELLDTYLESISNIAQEFRKVRKLLNVPIIDDHTFSIYAFGDEYLSVLIESYTYELLEYVKHAELPKKEVYTTKLLDLITRELRYRRKRNYPSIPDPSSSNEHFIFRVGVLKKYIGNVLFLNTRIKREGELLEQGIFALAAGIAMMFAAIAAFWAQSMYASMSLPLFLILIVSYMFKDRIKDLIRGYLGSRLRHLLFDHKLNIYYSPKKKIGWCKESFSFIKERKIPPHIMKLRNRDHITDIENGWLGEKTIVYRKRIKLYRRQLEHIYRDYQVESINDIMRLNVLKFLTKMDNPKKPVYVCEGQKYRKIYGRRVYNINMIMKYSMEDMVLYKRFRIVLSRNGIKRIDEVLLDEEFTS